MYGEKRVVGNYMLEQFIGYGASSVVFKGFDLKCIAHGVQKNVALKFIWNPEMAHEEIKRLEQTQTVFEICDLITYEEIPGSRVRELIGDTIRQLEKAMNTPIPIDDEKMVGVIVLQLIKGEHLIDRTLYHDEALKEHEWTINFENPEIGETLILKEWLTPVTRELNLEKRLEILIQLTKALEESHARGVVHGDLNPWNVFYHADTGRISIIDLGRNNFGVQGWRTPEHTQLMDGTIDALPEATDVNLLGQWMRYLLPKRGPWASIIQRCHHQNPDKRPTTQAVLKELKSISFHKPRTRILAIVALFMMTVIISVAAWKNISPFTIDEEGFNRVAVMPFEGSATGRLISDMVGKSLDSTRDFAVVRKKNTQAVAESFNLKMEGKPQNLRKASETLGAQFILTGKVDESNSGFLTWNGWLYQQNGAKRKLQARGQNTLILADAITAICLNLLNSNDMPFPASNFFSTNLNANFLYSYGDEFLEEGNVNAAAPMFVKALDADPQFFWAGAKLAFCQFRRGNFTESTNNLEQLLKQPDVLINPRLSATCREYLALLSYERGDWESARNHIQEGVLICKNNELTDNLSRLHAVDALIKTRQGDHEAAGLAHLLSEQLSGNSQDQITRINNILFQIASASAQGNEDLAYEKLREAREISERYGLESQEAILYKNEAILGLFKPASQISPEVEELLTKSRQIHARIGDDYQVLESEYYMAYLYKQKDNLGKATPLAKQVLQSATQNGVASLMIKASLLLADIANLKGNPDEAELYLMPILQGEHEPSQNVQLQLHSRLWKILARRGDYSQATEYLIKTQTILDKGSDQQAISYNYNNLGNLHERQGHYDQAWKYYEDSLRIKRELNDLWGIAWTLRNMTILSIKQDDLNRAAELMDELSTIDPDSFQSQLVLARLEYEKGNFERAIGILSSQRKTALVNGTWNQREETILNTYVSAMEAGEKLQLPEQFGNYY